MSDERFMRMALAEARKGVGRTSPNPAVGAVIVKDERVLARGFHRNAGGPHAEIEALRALETREAARGATLYVTLEPCSTRGRTGACVDELIEAGIGTVVIGVMDPNPRHAGRARELLTAAGIKVREGVLEGECREMNCSFNKWITTGIPLVIAKMAATLDGRLTRPPAESRWLTGAASRREVHALRAQVDAVLVGGATVRMDDPRLTVRNVPGARQPLRVIVSKTGNVPPDARLFTDDARDRTLLYAGQPLEAVLTDLGKRNVTSVLIEGGMRVLGEALDGRLIDVIHAYVAPWISGGSTMGIGGDGNVSARVARPTFQRFGQDVRITGDVIYVS